MSDTPRTDLKAEPTTSFRGISEVVSADFARQLERELNEWRKAASPVTDNPTEDAFYEKAEAAVKVGCTLLFLLLLLAGCATGPHKPPTEPIYSPFYNPNTGGVWVHGTLKDGTNWRTQAAQLGLVPTTVMGVEVWYNPQAVAPLNAEVHSKDYLAGYVAGEAEARSAFDRAMMRRTNSPNIKPNRQ